MNTAHISGHLELSDENFIKYYVPEINKYIDLQYGFVIGGAKGVDLMAQEYLLKFPNITVTIYDIANRDNRIDKRYNHKNSYKNFTDADIAMTNDSTVDIAFITRKESGTARNLLRRQFGDKIAKDIINIMKYSTDWQNKLNKKYDNDVTTIMDIINKHMIN